MPEDLRDRIVDFDLMLEGYVKLANEGSVIQVYNDRLVNYWDELSSGIMKVLRGQKDGKRS